MDLFDVMRSTASARDFTDRDVSDETLREILDNARFAPSGGNRQGWRVVVIRAPETKATLVELARPVMKRYAAQRNRGENPVNDVDPSAVTDAEVAGTDAPEGLLRAFRTAPVLLAILVDRRVVAAMDRELPRAGIVSGASIYPFVWNILLAARAHGLGGTITTFVSAAEPAALDVLGAPDVYGLAAVIPLGYPTRVITKLARKPVTAFASRERFDGPALD